MFEPIINEFAVQAVLHIPAKIAEPDPATAFEKREAAPERRHYTA